MNAATPRTNTPLLLLLDGILSQDEQGTDTALRQIEKLDPAFQYLQSIQTDSITGPSFSSEYESPLRSASALEEIVRRLLAINPYLAAVASESDGSLPLHFAASIGNIKVAALLLDHHRDAALTHNTKGKIPLHYAAREGRTEMVSFLLRLVPLCASTLTKKGKLALHFASGEGHTEVVRDILRVYPAGAILPSKKGKIALHFAARWGHVDIARDLCRIYPACIHTLDYDGSNPLHDATREGQFEMAKFLVERYPPVMHKSNIRGEIPLFAAIRSGNVPLCAFLIRSWPESGKQVLQVISDPDDVSSWKPAILNLCLRGAVSNFTDMSPQERGYTDDHARSIIDRILNINAETNSTNNPHQLFSDRWTHITDHSYNEESFASPQRPPPDSDSLVPRSKSPILELDGCKKKRSSSDGINCIKRQRQGSMDENDNEEGDKESCANCSYKKTLEKNTFYQVHAALECSATTNVLECVLERYPEQHSIQDDYGRLPLHIAISHCRSNGSVDFILERIWKPHQDFSFRRDFFGQLPLHLALVTRADSRLVRKLLDAFPSSGVEQCQVVGEQFSHMLPIHMAISHGCDLSTMFMLIRQDPSIVETWKEKSKKKRVLEP
jgi:ankyrin repeat protein